MKPWMLPGPRHRRLTTMRTLYTCSLNREKRREQEPYGTPGGAYTNLVPDHQSSNTEGQHTIAFSQKKFHHGRYTWFSMIYIENLYKPTSFTLNDSILECNQAIFLLCVRGVATRRILEGVPGVMVAVCLCLPRSALLLFWWRGIRVATVHM